ncbi:MAG: NAD-dependent deacylase [Bacteroidetes bacterium]|nr:NAD-dependent deacylase [Bacteroidota bacterium]
MKKLVVFTGAGISAESGIKTFRGSDGLWENYKITDVATFDAWQRNPAMVLDFYNQRRSQVMAAAPNEAHKTLVALEEYFDVHIITQNIDDLHERAGSKKVLHLHGEIMKARSTVDDRLIYELTKPEMKLGDTCEKGSQLRPHIVWFGEMVPKMEMAQSIAQTADVFVVIGTSLQVYPAAGLIDFVMPNVPIFLIDPSDVAIKKNLNIAIVKENASKGVKILFEQLMKKV